MELSEKYKIELINTTFKKLDTIKNFSRAFYPIHRKEFTKACFSHQ